jgi:hypothetical protein
MLPIPENKANQLNNDKIIAYITQLTETEKQAYLIAYQHLGTSFNILNSNGYKEYMKKNV